MLDLIWHLAFTANLLSYLHVVLLHDVENLTSAQDTVEAGLIFGSI